MLEPQDFTPDWFSKPADSLLDLMQRRRLSVEAVARALDGGVETLRELISGTRPIDRALANSLSAVVGGSTKFWLKRQANYERALDVAVHNALGELDQWLEHVEAPAGRPRRRLSKAQKAIELRERLAFYAVSNLRVWASRYGQTGHAAQFRTSQSFSSKDGPVALWLRQGELKAALTTTRGWDPSRLRDLLGDVLRLSKIGRPARFLPKLAALGAEAGVAIVAVRAPPGCRASGASRMIGPDKAMVLVSFRHLSDDHFWFTVLHEIGHLLLHGAKAFLDGDDTQVDDREMEANEFARACIIPPASWAEFADLKYDKDSVMRFGVSLGIAPGLVVGQLQHVGSIPRNQLNFLKRRWTWAEIEGVAN